MRVIRGTINFKNNLSFTALNNKVLEKFWVNFHLKFLPFAGSCRTFKSKTFLVFYVYVYGSVHRWSILITVLRDATQSSLFIILQVHSTCFGCQPHPSSAVHKTVTTASGTGHILCAATSLQRGQPHLSSEVHKTVTTASGTGHIVCAATSLQRGQPHLSSAVHKTVTTASGTGDIVCTATSLQRDQSHPSSGEHKTVTTASVTGTPTWPSLATLEGIPVTEAVVTVLCTPGDGCGWHPKHVEWTCRIIKRLLCVASRWSIIDIDVSHCCALN